MAGPDTVEPLARTNHASCTLRTSRKVMREGLSPRGGLWLHTMWAAGRRTLKPGGANSLDCVCVCVCVYARALSCYRSQLVM